MRSIKIFLLSLSLIFVSLDILKGYNSITVLDPKGIKKSSFGTIDSVSIVTRPKGIFLEVSLYMNIRTTASNYNANDSLEIVVNFDLPEGTNITESWLWLNPNTISKGKLLDVWTASSIYENIVKRRRDPSILKKINSTSYELRIFPLPAKSYRKIKLTYLIPAEFNGGEISKTLFFPLLNASSTKLIDAKWIAFPEIKYNAPKLKGATDIPFFTTMDPNFGLVYYKVVVISDLVNGVNISYPFLKNNPSAFSTFTSNKENYYQLSYKLDGLINQNNDQKILVILDLNPANTADKNFAIEQLHQSLLSTFNTATKINFLYYRKLFDLKYTFDDWRDASKENIDTAFVEIFNELGPVNITQACLLSALQYIKMHGNDGKIFLLTSDNTFNTAESTNNPIQVFNAEGLKNIPVTIADISQKQTGCNYIGNLYYCNSEYLFTNLAQISKGNYFVNYNFNGVVSNLIKTGVSSLLGTIYNLDVYLRTKDGFCYNKYNIMQEATNFKNQSIVHVGKFTGKPPFQVEMSGFLDKKPFNIYFEIPLENEIFSDSNLIKFWAGYQISQFEKLNGNSAISNTIEASINYGVLSRYTAFLCLEDSSYYCPNCKDESQTVTVVKNEGKDSMNISVYPNPFHDHVNVVIKHPNLDEVMVQLYNIQGQKLTENLYIEREDGQLSITWNPSEQFAAGVYLLSIQSPDSRKVIKLLRSDY